MIGPDKIEHVARCFYFTSVAPDAKRAIVDFFLNFTTRVIPLTLTTIALHRLGVWEEIVF